MMNKTELYKQHYKSYFNTIPEYWDDIYKRDTFYGYHYQKRRENIIKLLYKFPIEKGNKVLDEGCGAGGYFPDYLQAGLQVYGIDASEGMVEKVKDIYSDFIKQGLVHVSTGDIESLEFSDNYFDFAVSSGVLMYLPEMSKSLSEIYRVLKPGGLAVLNVDNHRNIAALLDVPAVFKGLLRHLPSRNENKMADEKVKVDERTESKPVTKSYTSRQLQSLATLAGFEIVDEAGHGFGRISLFGKPLLSDKINIAVYKLTEPMFYNKYIGRFGFTYSLLVRKPK